MGALPGYLTNIFISSGSSLAFSQLVLTDSGDHKKFALSATEVKRFWAPNSALIVETTTDGTTWTATTAYTAQYCGGAITLPAALSGTSVGVRVSGSYLAISFLGNATSVDIKPKTDILEDTSFTNPPVPWKTKVASTSDSDISLDKWYVDTTFIDNLQNRMVLVIYNGATPTRRYECYAFLSGDEIKIAVDALTDEPLTFTSDGPVYFYA